MLSKLFLFAMVLVLCACSDDDTAGKGSGENARAQSDCWHTYIVSACLKLIDQDNSKNQNWKLLNQR